MTVATEAAYAERLYTGVELSFTPGFAARADADVKVGYFDVATGVSVALTRGVHFSVARDAARAVTVTPIAFPSASVAVPVTIWITRLTPSVQGVNFKNLAQYDADVHEDIADAGAFRDAETRSIQARQVQPFTTSNNAVDFRPRVVKVATPVAAEDASTKAYADLVSGTSAAGQAAASAAAALVSQTAAAGSASGAATSAAAAAASAAILASPDYGFVSDAPSVTRDYGTIP